MKNVRKMLLLFLCVVTLGLTACGNNGANDTDGTMDGNNTVNDATDGKAWEEHNVHLSQVMGRNKNTHKGSEVLWKYALDHFISPNVEKGHLSTDEQIG